MPWLIGLLFQVSPPRHKRFAPRRSIPPRSLCSLAPRQYFFSHSKSLTPSPSHLGHPTADQHRPNLCFTL